MGEILLVFSLATVFGSGPVIVVLVGGSRTVFDVSGKDTRCRFMDDLGLVGRPVWDLSALRSPHPPSIEDGGSIVSSWVAMADSSVSDSSIGTADG